VQQRRFVWRVVSDREEEIGVSADGMDGSVREFFVCRPHCYDIDRHRERGRADVRAIVSLPSVCEGQKSRLSTRLLPACLPVGAFLSSLM